MDGKVVNIILWVLIGLFSIGILVLGFLMFRPRPQPLVMAYQKGRGQLAAPVAEEGGSKLEDFGLRLSQFMSPDESSKSKPKSNGNAAPAGSPTVLVGGGDLKLLSKPKSIGGRKPGGKPKPKMKAKRRK